MTNPILPPKKLYKYRAFNLYTLRTINYSELYYAPPDQLNDPFDCIPSLIYDTDRDILEHVWYEMVVSAYNKKCNKEKSIQLAQKKIESYRYNSTQYGKYDDDDEGETYYTQCLTGDIKKLLFNEMGKKGVLSLSEKKNCPLMWSHYADEHRGICIEYDLTEHICQNIESVDYDRPRDIKISDISAWKLGKSFSAEKDIYRTFFFSKAPAWKYENEWRDIDKAGIRYSPFNINAIFFGCRCDPSVITSIVMLLNREQTKTIKLYEMYMLNDTFDLKFREVCRDEVKNESYRPSDLEMLRGITDLDESES